MRGFLQNLGYRLSNWMYGRNGMDSLNHFLIIAAIVLNLLSYLPDLWPLHLLSSALLVWAIFRFCSKNLYKRQQENTKYFEIKNKFTRQKNTHKKMWDERATHKYFRCRCGTRLRVPRGKGKIEIHCPKCGNKMIKKS